MIDYLRPTEFVLDRVHFGLAGQHFTGRGLLTWEPETGFHLQAFLNQTAVNPNPFSSSGLVQVEDADDTHAIRIAGNGLQHGIVPNIFPHDLRSHIAEGRLSIRPRRVLFFQHFPALGKARKDTRFWSGNAVFVTNGEIRFPDSLQTDTTLNGHPIEGRSRSGLCVEEPDGLSVWGWETTQGLYTLSWALPKANFTKADAWRWAEAARQALSIVFAQVVWPIRITVTRGTKEITELRRKEQPHSLNYWYAPITEADPVEQWRFNKTTFIHLTRFLARQAPHADTCWSIFHRLSEASRQERWETKELIIGTTLEATLRTLDNKPFQPGRSSWKVRQSLDAFRRTHLGAGWEKACERVLAARSRLRHRNAHPDWITHPGGSFSKAEWRQSIEDLTFLSRFYGYMILAISGFKPLQPRFPVLRFK